MHCTDVYPQHGWIIWLVWPYGWVFLYKLSGSGFESCCNHLKTSDIAPVLSKEFLDIQANIECGFTLKRICDMITTYSQMHWTDKHSQHSSIIWPVWPNGWVFIYEPSGCSFESCCSHYKLFICPPDVKRPKSFRGLTPWTPTKALLWICCRAYSSLRPSSAFYNIQKLHISWKTDISKTAWINPWLCLRVWGFFAKPVIFFIIFSGDLYFDALIIGSFWFA